MSRSGPNTPGRVDEHVRRPELALDVARQRLDELDPAHVGREGACDATALGEPGLDLGEPLGPAGHERHARARSREGGRDLGAEAPARPGDESDPLRENAVQADQLGFRATASISTLKPTSPACTVVRAGYGLLNVCS